jgi:hypothetical protein
VGLKPSIISLISVAVGCLWIVEGALRWATTHPTFKRQSLYLIILSLNLTVLAIHRCHCQTERVLRKQMCLAVIMIR